MGCWKRETAFCENPTAGLFVEFLDCFEWCGCLRDLIGAHFSFQPRMNAE